MSEAARNAFHKVISDRQLFGRSLILGTAAAVAASLLIIVIVAISGGLAQVILHRGSAGVTGPVAAHGILATPLHAAIDAMPVLRRPAAALTVLAVLLGVACCLRTFLRSVAQGAISRHVAAGVNRLREHLQRHALRCNPGDLTGMQQTAAANLFRETAQQLEECARQWSFRRLTNAADLFVVTVLLVVVQWRVGLECAIPIVVCWLVGAIEAKRHAASADLLTEQVERGLEKLTDHLDKSRIVTGYGMETLEHDHFSKSLQSYQDRCERLRQQKTRSRWTATIVQGALFALPAFILARHLVVGSLISLPAAVAMTVLLGFLVIILKRLEGVRQLHGEATVAADAINHYLLRVPGVSQMVGARFLEPMSRLLQFNQVCVETETHTEVLSNLDLKIDFGQRIALLSLDGREAEALVSLIPRFIDPSRGQVLIDGQDIRKATLESLRAEAVVVSGDEPVFNTTVLDNITAGQQGISRQDAIEACKIAHAENFIRQLPRGYETHLGDNAQLLDVGQRYRISLARAIARNPALLVIREPEAILDSETKAMLDDTYHRICADRTVIFLPTRLSTVKKCDRIVMLHHGQVAADGRHDDLVRHSDLYRHWEYQRFNIFREDTAERKPAVAAVE